MIQKSVHRLLMTGFVAFISSLSLMAQHKVEMLPFGDMDQWVDRQIKESSIIGGNTKNVYAIGPTTVIKGDQVYKNMGGSPWATSNVMAKVAVLRKLILRYSWRSGEMDIAPVWIRAWRV